MRRRSKDSPSRRCATKSRCREWTPRPPSRRRRSRRSSAPKRRCGSVSCANRAPEWSSRRMRAPRRGWSRWARRAGLGLLALVVGESVWWTTQNNLPLGYAFLKPLWVLGYTPEPEMVEIPKGRFIMGCVEGRDDLNGECPDEETPSREVAIPRSFTVGKYEVTFLQYDTYVFHQRRNGKDVDYPEDADWGRFGRPV